MASEDAFGLEGTELEGRYEIHTAIAEGGFGVVYRGRHIQLEKPVAVKVLKIREGLSDRAVAAIYEQFGNEARTVARLRHPNIVQAIDLGRSVMPGGTKAPWMALEWIEGQTLRHWLRDREGATMSPRAALELLRPVFDALALAHENQVAHRDIKPANVMVVEGRGRLGRQLLLMDFGIAKMMEAGEAAAGDEARTGSVIATYTRRYGAPEQAMGRRTGPWTDVHAMALLLVEAMTGAPAYRNEHEHADGLMGLILANERPTPARLGLDVGSWEPVIARALDRTPAKRYPNAGEFLAALDLLVATASPIQPARVASGGEIRRTASSNTPAERVLAETPVTGNRILMPPAYVRDTGAEPAPPDAVTTAAPVVVGERVSARPRGNTRWIALPVIAAAVFAGLLVARSQHSTRSADAASERQPAASVVADKRPHAVLALASDEIPRPTLLPPHATASESVVHTRRLRTAGGPASRRRAPARAHGPVAAPLGFEVQ